MSWLISQALMEAYANSPFSQALGEEFSRATCSDGEPSAPLNVMPTPHKFWRNDKTMEASELSRFGLTCRLLTEDHGAALLTWFRAGFPARTSALQAKVQASQAHAQACGPTWRASLARFDPVSCGWKTVQLSLLGDSELFSVIWPRSGMTAGGQYWELPMLGRTTKGTDSGFWPTPNAMKATNDLNLRCSGDGRSKPNKLGWAVASTMWPTQTVCGNYNRKGASATIGDGLATAVKTWATPVYRDYRSPGLSRMERTGSKSGDPLPQQVGGILNPMWVEKLMGDELSAEARSKSTRLNSSHITLSRMPSSA